VAELQRLLAERTAEVEQLRSAMAAQTEENQRTSRQLTQYQDQLRRLSLELSLTEARERRNIAEELHDHIGQALAFVKLKVSQFRGNAVFCGFEDSIGEVITLLDQTIAYTRGLTLQLCPPVLSRAGLLPAIEWLAEKIEKDHPVSVKVRSTQLDGTFDDERSLVLYRSIKELMTNAVHHSGCRNISVTLLPTASHLTITVDDDGRGFDVDGVLREITSMGKFGLFSVQERMRLLGGEMNLSSNASTGTRIELRIPLPTMGRTHE
jgi:signal transduction histidine kinase